MLLHQISVSFYKLGLELAYFSSADLVSSRDVASKNRSHDFFCRAFNSG